MLNQKIIFTLPDEKKEEILGELVKAGAIQRDKPRTYEDPYFSSSIGKKGEKTLEIKI